MIGTSSRGPQWLWASIQEVGDDWATVIDQHGKMRSVTTKIVRSMQVPHPGEWWIIDQSFGGQWTFAAAGTGFPEEIPVSSDSELFHWLGL